MIRTFKLSMILLTLASLLIGANPFQNPEAAPAALQVSIRSGFPITDPGSVDFSSPAVIDINGDGKLDILVGDGGGCIWAWDPNGNVLPGFPLKISNSCGGPRVYGPIAIGDIDGDGKPEIVAGAAGTSGGRGKVYAWNHDGSPVPGWPQETEWNSKYGMGEPEVSSIALGNILGDARLEVIAGTNNNAAGGGSDSERTANLYAWKGDGSLIEGYPTWYRTAGIWGQVGVANLTGDSYSEVIAGRDERFMHAYSASGGHLNGWPVETFVDPNGPGEDPLMEFTYNAPVMADLDGDGRVETIIAGKVRGARAQGRREVNSGVIVIEPDGQRAAGWEIARLGDGPPLYDSFDPSQAPALADLDGDGKLEIIVNMTDGKTRAFRFNGELMWKYDFAGGRKLFGSEPVVGDINGDGKLEVVFGTYSPDGSAGNAAGILALDSNGRLLEGFPLPLTKETSSSKKGIRSAPTLADIDGDCQVEIVAASWSGTLYAWDLSGPYNEKMIPWPTGRHDLQRTGWFNQALSKAEPGQPAQPPAEEFSGSQKLYLPAVSSGCSPR